MRCAVAVVGTGMARSYWVAVWLARLSLVLVPGGFCLFGLAWTGSTTYIGVLGVYWLVTIAVMSGAWIAAASIGVPVGFQLRRSWAVERMKWDFFCYDVLGLREPTNQVDIEHVLLYRTPECWLFSIYQEPGGITSGELADTSPDAPVEVAQQDLLAHLRGTWQFTGQLTWEQTKPDWWAAEPASDREGLGQAPT
jgi:hypothetical protein